MVEEILTGKSEIVFFAATEWSGGMHAAGGGNLYTGA